MNQRGQYGRRRYAQHYVGQTFLLKEVGKIEETFQKFRNMQQMLRTFWQFAKSQNPYDPETAALMHSTLTKISEVLGVRRA